MSISVFLSTVSDEFRTYRDRLRGDLTRHNVEVKVQEDFKGLGRGTLDKLDDYIAHCDVVVHLVGDMTGSAPDDREVQALLRKHPDLRSSLPPLDAALRNKDAISYTQWEAWLALYHGKLLLTAKALAEAPRGPAFAPTDASRGAQAAHLARLEAVSRYPDCSFESPADLARHIAYTAILDLLVQDYASEAARARDIAEGFIREMAGRVADDPHLDLDGMKQAVRTAIEIYEQEIAGGRSQTNFGDIVDRALANAKRLADAGKSGLARAALRRTANDLQREEADRRAAHAERLTALFGLERDIALAAYDGDAAADAILGLAGSLHGDRADARRGLLIAEGDQLYEYGGQRGSNVHLIAAIAVRRATLRLAATPDETGHDRNNLGNALWTLGERESGTARLEEAVAAYRAALEERTRERVPLDWARTQNNLGTALRALGERESGTARLEEAVAAYRAALEEMTRERVPLDWATTQNNLGAALQTLGERESGTARLEEAVAAYRAALEEMDARAGAARLGDDAEQPRQRARDARRAGERDGAAGGGGRGLSRGAGGKDARSGAARLGDDAEQPRHRARDAWASGRAGRRGWRRRSRPIARRWRNGRAIGCRSTGRRRRTTSALALATLGERESGTARLEEAVAAYRAALEEMTRDRVPLDWATTQNNLGTALSDARRAGERDGAAGGGGRGL